MPGIYAIYKPKGPTSFGIIYQLKKITGIKKIGHGGTLDPLASGVLVVGIGREATKKLGESLNTKEKEYIAKIKFGQTSTTDDEEGQKTEFTNFKKPDLGDIANAIKNFEGEILQTPPIFSALKIGGKRAYKLARQYFKEKSGGQARQGKAPEMKPRKALIKKIELISYQWPYLEIKVTTGPGVYIRALARDLGQALDCGGYLADLERTRVGNFTKESALTIEKFIEQHQTNKKTA